MNDVLISGIMLSRTEFARVLDSGGPCLRMFNVRGDLAGYASQVNRELRLNSGTVRPLCATRDPKQVAIAAPFF